MKSIKKMLLTFVVLCLMAFSATGCFKKDVIVATVNGKPITEQLYYINLWSTLRDLESMQEGYWNFENLLGKSPEEFAKTKTLEAATRCIILEQKAEELDINDKLTKEEKEMISDKAKNSMKEQEDFVKEHNIKQKDFETYYRYAILDKKVIEALSASYEPNDEEVLTEVEEMKANGDLLGEAEVTHILFMTKDEQGNDLPEDKKEQAYKEAQEVLEKAVAGVEMEELVDDYRSEVYVSQEIGKDHFSRSENYDEALENVIFEKAEIGTIYPSLVETSLGYEIIRVDECTKESEEDLKVRAIKNVKEKYAQNELKEMANFADIEKTEFYNTISANLTNGAEETK